MTLASPVLPTPISRTHHSGDHLYAAVPGLASADLDGEVVLLDVSSGRYFGLNGVAARIFNLVTEPRTLAQVVDVLVAEYEADRALLHADATAFLDELVQRGLVRVTSGRS